MQDKENAPQSGKKVCKQRRETTESLGNSKFYQSSSQESLNNMVEQSFSTDGVIPSTEAAEQYFLGGVQSPPPLPPKPKHLPLAPPPQAAPRPRVRRAVYLDQPTSSFV